MDKTIQGSRVAVHAEEPSAPSSDDVRSSRRVVIQRVWPEIDGGRFPIKRTIGEAVTVSADIFADGHDLLAGVVKYRRLPTGRAPDTARGGTPSDPMPWRESPLVARDNDRWEGEFVVTELGDYEYTVEAWIDRFGSWLTALIIKADAGQEVASELLEGGELIRRAAATGRATSPDTRRLLDIAKLLESDAPTAARVWAAKDTAVHGLMAAHPDRSTATLYERTLVVRVDSIRARFGAWYELFPRSVTSNPARSGTFREAETRLADVAAMGFDVVYLPPVHPIGVTHRKGRNNSLTAAPDDPGSPWAIGSHAGGHTAIDPGLGTIEDFDRFVRLANRLGLDVALDIAFQTSPDHPWVREHPEWFRHRPDGSIKYAENPPKKYQDIYPLDFDSAQWESLWQALRDVFLFWIGHGVRVFRVDNPHTKPFRFWEWVIGDIRRDHPDTVFLAEAFTRPKVMQYLAKAGFNQSYTYFTWRNSAHELRDYMTELTRSELQEYMRPNFFANTPDILHAYLQIGGRPAFQVRLILAAMLAASYGIYSGFELCENVPVKAGSEEYLDSEKYQIKPRDWQQADSLRELIARVNQIRREQPALHTNATLTFYDSDNPALLWFGKSRSVFVVANTDPHSMQHGWVQMPIWELGIRERDRYVVEDLLDGARYTWGGAWNYVRLDPAERVAHVLVIRHVL